MSSLLDRLSQPEAWEAFYKYKSSLAVKKRFTEELRGFIDRRAYLPVCDAIANGERFPLPKKSVISKMSSQKKRTVYSYPRDESTVLKLLTWLMLREYDAIFPEPLFSFRPGRTAKDAIRFLTGAPGIEKKFAYKADVSDYFNSIPTDRLLPILSDVLKDDPALRAFLISLLLEPEALENGRPVTEKKGIMAGTPLSAFYANLYLREMDKLFEARQIPYARYSDDIIVFGDAPEEVAAHAETIRSFLHDAGLQMNPEKETFSSPDDGWSFLGFRYCRGEIDLSPASLTKMKQKMRRKTRALKRWQERKGLEPEKAATAFIRAFNAKLFENTAEHELTWARWFFPVLTTSDSLGEIDRYAQDCIRYLATDKRTKARFNCRYKDIKRMGYKSLVHEFYAVRDRE